MKMEEYLKSGLSINLNEVAKRMWPNNPSAKTYMSAKLNGKEKKWTPKDTEKAKQVLRELYQSGLNQIDNLK